MNKITAKELRQSMQKARKAKETAAKKVEAIKAKDERKKKLDETQAEQILKNVPAITKLAASSGRDFAAVMGLRSGTDYQYNVRSGGFNELQPSELVGAAAIVYAECRKIFDAITLEFWQATNQSGFSMIVHW